MAIVPRDGHQNVSLRRYHGEAPAGGSQQARSKRLDLGGEHLGHHDHLHGQQAAVEGDHQHHRRDQQHDRVRGHVCVEIVLRVEEAADHEVRRGGGQAGESYQRFATQLVDEEDGDRRGDHLHHADRDVGRVIGDYLQLGGFEEELAVRDQHEEAANVMGDRDEIDDDKGTTTGARGQQPPYTAGLPLLLPIGLDDRPQFFRDVHLTAQLLQRRLRLVRFPCHGQIVRRLRHEPGSDCDGDGHGQPDDRRRRYRQVRHDDEHHENAEIEHNRARGSSGASRARRRNFSDVHREYAHELAQAQAAHELRYIENLWQRVILLIYS